MKTTVLPFYNDRYFSRTFDIVFKTPGVLKCLGLLALINLIPIIGQIWTLGFFMKICRNTAWGLKVPISTKDLDFVSCIKLGFIGSLVSLVYVAASLLISEILESLYFVGILLNYIAGLIIGLMCLLAIVRVSIYGTFLSGFSFRNMYKMLMSDPGGCIRAYLVGLVYSVMLLIPLYIIIFTMFISMLMQATWVLTDFGAVNIVRLLLANLPLVLLTLYLCAYISILCASIQYIAIALWTLQFNVADWKGPNDDMPEVIKHGDTPNVEVEESVCECTASDNQSHEDESALDTKPQDSCSCSYKADDEQLVKTAQELEVLETKEVEEYKEDDNQQSESHENNDNKQTEKETETAHSILPDVEEKTCSCESKFDDSNQATSAECEALLIDEKATGDPDANKPCDSKNAHEAMVIDEHESK